MVITYIDLVTLIARKVRCCSFKCSLESVDGIVLKLLHSVCCMNHLSLPVQMRVWQNIHDFDQSGLSYVAYNIWLLPFLSWKLYPCFSYNVADFSLRGNLQWPLQKGYCVLSIWTFLHINLDISHYHLRILNYWLQNFSLLASNLEISHFQFRLFLLKTFSFLTCNMLFPTWKFPIVS